MASDSIWKHLLAEWASLDEPSPIPGGKAAEYFAQRAAPGILLASEIAETRRLWRQVGGASRVAERVSAPATSAWTVKDLLAHVASWSTEIRREIMGVLRNEQFSYVIPYALSKEGPTEWNHAEVQKRSGHELAQVLGECDEALAGLEEISLTEPSDVLTREFEFPLAPRGAENPRWSGSIDKLVRLQCWHVKWHLAKISDLSKGPTVDRS